MDTNNTDLLIVDDYIDQDLIDHLLAEPIGPREHGRHDWTYSGNALDETIWRVSDDLKAFYKIDEPLYADYIVLTATEPGMSHILHADSEKLDGTPNHSFWRTVTAMLYLNSNGEDFEGGEISFPRIGQIVAPKRGRMVGFRCDGIHAHEVPPVTSGIRRAVAVWFTHDLNYKDSYARKAS